MVRSAIPPPGTAAIEEISGEFLLIWRRARLREGGGRAELDWLLDLAGGVPWRTLQMLRLQPQRRVALARPLAELEGLWKRHLRTAEPLQYLVGLCPWRDLALEVAPGVLIPRQETERMLDLALAMQGERPPRLWADLGTGSGCLAIALARDFPGAHGFAVDRSPSAAAVAARNLARFQLSATVRLLEGDWWQPLRPWWGRFDLVLANPPYIPTSVLAGLAPVVRDHEPRLALDGGEDGLAAIRAVAAAAPEALAPGGLLLLEHHHDQSASVCRLLAAAGLERIETHRDLEGVVRFASGRRPSGAVP
jgi:release factor glutamine methyltransferase